MKQVYSSWHILGIEETLAAMIILLLKNTSKRKYKNKHDREIQPRLHLIAKTKQNKIKQTLRVQVKLRAKLFVHILDIR